jgi:non-heme chloroperoxidase
VTPASRHSRCVSIAGRGHSLTIDAGWREVADTALAFIKRFV